QEEAAFDSNVEELWQPAPKQAPAAEPELLLTRVVEPAQVRRRTRARALERWLAQGGATWLTSGALALGAVLFLAWAAQQGVFARQLWLLGALALGFGLIGGGEWFRRSGFRPHLAAGLAGAGALALYSAAWASYTTHGALPWAGAAGALGASAALLL